MTLFDIVPIEYHGMSIITAIILVITGTGVSLSMGVLLRWVFDKFERHDNCLHEHDLMLANVVSLNADTKSDIKETRTVVDRIDASLDKITETNMEVLKSYLKKGE